MIGQLPTTEIEKLLKTSCIGRIGCYADGEIYVVPILYAYDGSYIYGHSREGKKISMMRKHPDVCFEVDDMKNLANWQSVIIQALYEELLGTEMEKAKAIFLDNMQPRLKDTMRVSAYGMVDFHQREQDGIRTVFFRLKPKEKSGRFEKQP